MAAIARTPIVIILGRPLEILLHILTSPLSRILGKQHLFLRVLGHDMLRHLLLPTVPPPQIPSHRRKDSSAHDRSDDNPSNVPLSKPRPAVIIVSFLGVVVLVLVLVLVVRVPRLLLRVLLVVRARDVEAGNIERERLGGDERDVRARVEGLVDGQVAAVVAVVRVDVLGDVAQLEGGVGAGRGVGDEAGEVEADVAVVEGLDAVRGDDDLELGVVGRV